MCPMLLESPTFYSWHRNYIPDKRSDSFWKTRNSGLCVSRLLFVLFLNITHVGNVFFQTYATFQNQSPTDVQVQSHLCTSQNTWPVLLLRSMLTFFHGPLSFPWTTSTQSAGLPLGECLLKKLSLSVFNGSLISVIFRGSVYVKWHFFQENTRRSLRQCSFTGR